MPEVRLDAEEDMCKYNRLVKYYENLGFRQLEGSKVHYIHHCDQVFRKVCLFVGWYGVEIGRRAENNKYSCVCF